jgi:hypothetical protein
MGDPGVLFAEKTEGQKFLETVPLSAHTFPTFITTPMVQDLAFFVPILFPVFDSASEHRKGKFVI